MSSLLKQDTNDISTRQNDEKIKLLFFSQKFIYRNLKTLKYIMWVLAIISLLSGIFLKQHLEVKVIIGAGIFIFTWLLDSYINKRINLAATTQELADRSLYGFSKDIGNFNGLAVEKISEEAKKIRDKDLEIYKVIINNKGTDTPPGVKDWYDDINISIPRFEAILKCQKQNVYWDKKLIEMYRIFLCICIAIVILLGVIMFWNRDMKNFIFTAITGLPILKIIILEIYNSNKYINYSKEIDGRISSIKAGDSINTVQLQELQAKIYERRRSGFTVPDYFHHKYTKVIHKKFRNSNI